MRLLTYADLKELGLCVQCGDRKPVPGMVMCDPCGERHLDLNRLNYALAQLRGNCPRHRRRPVEKGFKQCAECRAKDRIRDRIRRNAA